MKRYSTRKRNDFDLFDNDYISKKRTQDGIINVIGYNGWRMEEGKSLKKHRDKETLRVKMVKLADIEQSVRNIFFIESSCATRPSNGTGRFPVSARQACSVESAARMNPSRPVYVMHTCPLASSLPTHALSLLHLPNVFLVPLRMQQALRDSPVFELYRKGRLRDSLYPVVHASDVLRLVILWRFGGTYCDLDVLSIKPLDQLGSNFCGLEGHNYIGSSVLNFEPHGYGDDILTRILHKVGQKFNGQSWADNGPTLLTNSMLKECNTTDYTLSQCKVFNVLNTTVFYPLPYYQHKTFFNDSQGPDTVAYIKGSGSYMVHFWNQLSSKLVVQVNSSQAYALLAHEFCPETYRKCGDKF